MIPSTIGELLKLKGAQYPLHPAIIYHDRDLIVSYRELLETSQRVARALRCLGISPGEHLAVWAHNVPEWIYLQFGCALAGVVLVTVNTSYRTFELEYLLKQSEAVALFMVNGFRKPGEFLAMAHELCPELENASGGKRLSPGLPHLRKIVLMDNAVEPGVVNWEEFMALADSYSPDETVQIDPGQVAMMQYTSGTTGFPKGVMLSHANLLGNVRDVADVLEMTPDDRLCIPVPFFHCFGSVMGTLLCLAAGSTMLPLEQFRPVEVLRTVHSRRCTLLHGVPAMFIAELEEFKKGGYDTSSLRSGIMGGSPCPLEVMRATVSILGIHGICIAYGLTETSPLITVTPPQTALELRASTVGITLPGVEVKIVNQVSGETVPPGMQGELCCRGYNVMLGYFRMPEATARVIDPDGWFHSGDLATMDAEGYVRITGRATDMIIRSGENIYPREIEEFLFTHPAIRDAQVVGVPSALRGEEVAAFVQIREGAEADSRQIRSYCRGRIARHKVPRYVALVEAFPVTASGKVQKYKLREQAIRLFGLEDEARKAIVRSAVLLLQPHRDSSDTVFSFIDSQVAPWSIDVALLFRASAALNELFEMVTAGDLSSTPLETCFSFDSLKLSVTISYRGNLPEFPQERPSPENLVTDAGGLSHLSGFLVRRYAGQLDAGCQGDLCSIRLDFEV